MHGLPGQCPSRGKPPREDVWIILTYVKKAIILIRFQQQNMFSIAKNINLHFLVPQSFILISVD